MKKRKRKRKRMADKEEDEREEGKDKEEHDADRSMQRVRKQKSETGKKRGSHCTNTMSSNGLSFSSPNVLRHDAEMRFEVAPEGDGDVAAKLSAAIEGVFGH